MDERAALSSSLDSPVHRADALAPKDDAFAIAQGAGLSERALLQLLDAQPTAACEKHVVHALTRGDDALATRMVALWGEERAPPSSSLLISMAAEYGCHETLAAALLAHPEVSGYDLLSPLTSAVRRGHVQAVAALLPRIPEEWCREEAMDAAVTTVHHPDVVAHLLSVGGWSDACLTGALRGAAASSGCKPGDWPTVDADARKAKVLQALLDTGRVPCQAVVRSACRLFHLAHVESFKLLVSSLDTALADALLPTLAERPTSRRRRGEWRTMDEVVDEEKRAGAIAWLLPRVTDGARARAGEAAQHPAVPLLLAA